MLGEVGALYNNLVRKPLLDSRAQLLAKLAGELVLYIPFNPQHSFNIKLQEIISESHDSPGKAVYVSQ